MYRESNNAELLLGDAEYQLSTEDSKINMVGVCYYFVLKENFLFSVDDSRFMQSVFY